MNHWFNKIDGRRSKHVTTKPKRRLICQQYTFPRYLKKTLVHTNSFAHLTECNEVLDTVMYIISRQTQRNAVSERCQWPWNDSCSIDGYFQAWYHLILFWQSKHSIETQNVSFIFKEYQIYRRMVRIERVWNDAPAYEIFMNSLW